MSPTGSLHGAFGVDGAVLLSDSDHCRAVTPKTDARRVPGDRSAKKNAALAARSSAATQSSTRTTQPRCVQWIACSRQIQLRQRCPSQDAAVRTLEPPPCLASERAGWRTPLLAGALLYQQQPGGEPFDNANSCVCAGVVRVDVLCRAFRFPCVAATP